MVFKLTFLCLGDCQADPSVCLGDYQADLSVCLGDCQADPSVCLGLSVSMQLPS